MKPAERANRRHVLVTGAAGGIGQAFVHSIRDRYWLRLADSAPIASETMHTGDRGEADDTIQLDIADLAASNPLARG